MPAELLVPDHIARERVAAAPTAIVCAYRGLSVPTVESLIRLTDAGWRYRIHSGDALISRVRAKATAEWFRAGVGDVFLMVDDDMEFSPAAAIKVVALARAKRGIACGAYVVRDGTHMALRPLENRIAFGPEAEPVRIRYAATGFMAVHRDVIAELVRETPLCHADKPWAFWPMFDPMTVAGPGGELESLSEDWAFCHRASDAGFEVWLDPSVLLIHHGSKGYTLRDLPGAQ